MGSAPSGYPDYGAGNPFNSNKIAMTIQPIWYFCCMQDLSTWEMAAMPSYNGKVGGLIHDNTFRT